MVCTHIKQVFSFQSGKLESGGAEPPLDSVFDNESESLLQLDGNVSILSDSVPNSSGFSTTKNNKGEHQNRKPKHDKISTAINLPIIATYNVRSLIPKIQSVKISSSLYSEWLLSKIAHFWRENEAIRK